jgi:hypothetical protein
MNLSDQEEHILITSDAVPDAASEFIQKDDLNLDGLDITDGLTLPEIPSDLEGDGRAWFV